MINFLKCDAKAIIKLILELSYQDKNNIRHEVIEVDTNTIYRITAIDSIHGIETLIGRIKSFTLCPEREVLSYINQDTKPSIVDTITIKTKNVLYFNLFIIRTINVSDIRSVSELADAGFEEIPHTNISTFN